MCAAGWNYPTVASTVTFSVESGRLAARKARTEMASELGLSIDDRLCASFPNDMSMTRARAENPGGIERF